MSLLTLEEARAHLRVGPTYPEAQIRPYLDAAEDAASRYMRRAIYSTTTDLTEARAQLPNQLQVAEQERNAALIAARAVTNLELRRWLEDQAHIAYESAFEAARRVSAGIVINPSIRAAILLQLGHLDQNREDVITGTIVSAMVQGSQDLLFPYMVGFGG